MKFNIETLRKYEEEGWIYSQVHPSLPLIIWNYSDLCQYSSYWDKTAKYDSVGSPLVWPQENMLDKWLEEHGDPQIEKYVELKLAIIDIIGFNMEPERAELKAEELIKLFEEYKKAPN